MKSYSSREIIKLLQADGWSLDAIAGSHHQFRHPVNPGRVTVAQTDPHARRDLPAAAVRSIARQAGIRLD